MCKWDSFYTLSSLLTLQDLFLVLMKVKGLGNQFLDDARQAEVLIHVVDIAGTTDIQGQPVPVGTHDPLRRC